MISLTIVEYTAKCNSPIVLLLDTN